MVRFRFSARVRIRVGVRVFVGVWARVWVRVRRCGRLSPADDPRRRLGAW